MDERLAQPMRPVAPDGVGNGLLPSQMSAPGSRAHQGLVNEFVTLVSSFLGGTSDRLNINAILNPDKKVINRLRTIYNAIREPLLGSTACVPFNLSYTTNGPHTRNLVNQTTVVTPLPAQLRCSGHRPPPSSQYVIEQHYTMRSLFQPFEVPGELVENVRKMRTRLKEYDILGAGAGEGSELLRIREEVEHYVQEVIQYLESMMSMPAANAKESIEMGIVDQAILAVEETAMPLPLAEVVHRHSTSIADKGAKPGDWQLDQNMVKNLTNDTIKQHCERAYMLAKHPQTALAEVIDAGRRTVNTALKFGQDVAVIDQDSQAPFEVEGIIYISEEASRFMHKSVQSGGQMSSLPLRNGRMISQKSIYFKPLSEFAKDQSNSHVIMLYDKDQHRLNKTSGNALAKVVSDYSRSISGDEERAEGFIELVNIGRRIMFDEDHTAVDGTDLPEDLRHELSVVQTNIPVEFVVYDNKATIISTVYRKHAHLDDPHGRSPTLVSLKHQLFHVSVGDIDINSKKAASWLEAIVTGSPDFKRGDVKDDDFSMKTVHAYSPGLANEQYHFGTNELISALCDPSLYSVTDLQNQLNVMLDRASAVESSQYNYLKTLLRAKLTAAQWVNDLWKQWSKNRTNGGGLNAAGDKAASSLEMIDLTPFYNTDAEQVPGGGNRYQFVLRHRTIFLGLPPPVRAPQIGRELVGLRATHFLAKTATVQQINDLEAKLTTLTNNLMKTGKLTYGELAEGEQVPAETVNLCKTLVGLLKKFYGSLGYKLSDITDLMVEYNIAKTVDDDATPRSDWWAMFKYAVAPVIGRFHNVKYLGELTNEVIINEMVVFNDGHTEDHALYDGDQFMIGTKTPQLIPSLNTHEYLVRSGWPLIKQVAALIMQRTKLSPIGMAATIMTESHPMFTVDFVASMPVYNEQMVYTKPRAHEMIMSPGTMEGEMQDDSTCMAGIGCEIQTARNTLGAGAMVVQMVYPNPHAATTHVRTNGNPIVSLDSVARTREGNLNGLLQTMISRNLDVDTTKMLRDHFTGIAVERERRHRGGEQPHLNRSDRVQEFVAMVRPCRQATHEPLPVMGISKAANMPLSGSRKSPWETVLTSKDETINPYASQLGGYEFMRRVPNDTHIGHDRTFLLSTTCHKHIEDDVSGSTRALEQIFNMNDAAAGCFTEADVQHVTTLCVPLRPSTTPVHIAHDQMRAPIASDQLDDYDIPAKYGMSIPLTYTTNRQLLERIPLSQAGGSIRFDGSSMNFTVCSPYTAAQVTKSSYSGSARQ